MYRGWTVSLVAQSLMLSFGIIMGVYAFRGFDLPNLNHRYDYVVAYVSGNLFGIGLTLIPLLIMHPRIGREGLFLTFLLGITLFPLINFLGFRAIAAKMPPLKFLVVGINDELLHTLKEIEAASVGKIQMCNTTNPEPDRLNHLITHANGHNAILVGDLEFARNYRASLDLAESQGVTIEYVPRLAERILQRIPIEILEIYHDYYDVVFSTTSNSAALRAFDIVFSLILLPFLMPLMGLGMLLVLLLDGRPIFFLQKRHGYLGRKFPVYKLRTMDNVTDENGKKAVKLTRSGRFLRKTRLNEIPQILNVLKGHMSLVGSRPDIRTTYAFCTKCIPFYARRNAIRPGITGHAQVRYRYVDKVEYETFARRLSFDLYYIKNISFNLYLRIALRTVETMLFKRGT